MLKKNIRWTEDEKDLVLKWRKEGLSFKQIAEDLQAVGYPKRTNKAIIRCWQKIKDAQANKSGIVENIIEVSEDLKKAGLVDDRDVEYTCVSEKDFYEQEERCTSDCFADLETYKKGNDLFNYISYAYKDEVNYKYKKALDEMEEIRKKALSNVNKWDKFVGNPAKEANVKVVSLSDTHIPFHNNDVVNDMLDKHADADVLVLNGDILEHYSVSSWPKNKSIMLRHEYEIGIKFIRLMADIFPKVIITRGNHEERLQKYFASNLDYNVSFMVNPDMLDRMANGYDFNEDGELEKMYQMDNVFYNKGPMAYFCQIGKCIFAHPSSFSSIPMRTTINAATGFSAKGYDFEALVMGHTHKMGSLIHNRKLLIEQGCACIPLEYEAGSKMAYKPQSFGYAVIYMDKDGHVDFDKSGPVYCGSGSIKEEKNFFTLEGEK